MPFLGKQPPSGFSSYTKQDLTADGSTTGFTLNKNVASANDVEVFVGNVRQEPTDAYTVSGNTLTMSAAPSSGTNFYVMFKEATQSTTVPSAGTTVPGNFGLTGTLSVDTIDVSTGSRVEFNEAIYTGDADGFRVGNIQLSRKDAYSTTDSYFGGSLPASGGSAPFNNYDHVVINAKSGRQIYFGTGGSERVRITDAGLSFDGGSNHLDDYEEGTWTPELGNHGASYTNSSTGVYTKIGNIVYVAGQIDVSGVDTSDPSPIGVSGFPFVVPTAVQPLGDIDWRDQTLIDDTNLPDNAKVVWNVAGVYLEVRDLKGNNTTSYSARANSSGRMRFSVWFRI